MTIQFAATDRPRACPWGSIDEAKEIAPGIWLVETPSHGGLMISAERRAAMPAYLRDVRTYAGGNAYEEDCDWSLVAAAFPDCFTPRQVEAARATILSYDREPRAYDVAGYHDAMRKAAQCMKAAQSQEAA